MKRFRSKIKIKKKYGDQRSWTKWFQNRCSKRLLKVAYIFKWGNTVWRRENKETRPLCCTILHASFIFKMVVYFSMFIRNSMDIKCGSETAVLLLFKITFWWTLKVRTEEPYEASNGGSHYNRLWKETAPVSVFWEGV